MEGLSEYELQRLEHIKRNQEFLARLGLAPLSKPAEDSVDNPEHKRETKPKTPKEPLEPVRRSGRQLNKAPDYTGETIDRFSELLDKECGTRRSAQVGVSEEEYRESLLESSREWLRTSREALLRVGLAIGKVPETKDEWKEEAVRRWGPYVEQAANVTDWETYVTTRLSMPPPPSPLDLLQEYYAHDTWQLLVCCTLMSRVSSWDTKHRVIAAFFAKYPTPSAVLDADAKDAYEVLYPLGLFENRMQSLLAVTKRILEMPAFDIGLDPQNKVYGIGEFGYHSYLLFCRDAGKSLKPKDKALASFAAWRKQLADQQPEQGGDDKARTDAHTTDSATHPVNPDSQGPLSLALDSTIQQIADGAGSDTGEAPKRRSSRAPSKRKIHTAAAIAEPSDDTPDVTAPQPQPAKKHKPAVRADASAAASTPPAPTGTLKRTPNAGTRQTTLSSFFKREPPVSTRD